MATENKTVNVVVGMQGTHLKLTVPHSEYQRICKAVESKSHSKWITVGLEKNAEVRFNPETVQYLKLLPRVGKKMEKRSGYTLKQIADVKGESYDYLRQKVKREAMELDKLSDRRILLTKGNIEKLNLGPSHINKLKAPNK